MHMLLPTTLASLPLDVLATMHHVTAAPTWEQAALAAQALLGRRHIDAGGQVAVEAARVELRHGRGEVLHVLEHLAARPRAVGQPVGVAAAEAQDAIQPGVRRRILLQYCSANQDQQHAKPMQG